MKSKKNIYILHGWAYDIEKWAPFLQLLNNSGIETEMLKIPGLTAPIAEVWDIDDYIDWLYSKVKNDKDITLLGHSNGGLISIGFALKYPDKIKNLFLLDSTGIFHNEFSIKIKRSIFMILAKIGKNISSAPIFRKLLYKLARAHDYEKASPLTQKIMQNLIKVDYSNQLKNIKAKTYIIWGEHDMLTPLRDGKFMNRSIPNSELFIIKNARHSPQLTNPDQVYDIVINNI